MAWCVSAVADNPTSHDSLPQDFSHLTVSEKQWLAHASSWEALLAAWDNGVMTVMWPGIRLPFMGLWSALE